MELVKLILISSWSLTQVANNEVTGSSFTDSTLMIKMSIVDLRNVLIETCKTDTGYKRYLLSTF